MSTEARTRKVLFPIDGSEHSERAVRWYIDNLKNDHDFLVLFHCVDLSGVLPTMTLTAGAPLPVAAMEAEIKAKEVAVKKLKSKFEVILKDHGFKGEFIYTTKFPHASGEGIIWACGEYHIEHIVIGSRGLGTIRRTFMGSVSDYVLHHAHLPVTVVPPPSH